MTLTATRYVIQMTSGNVEQNQKVIFAAQTGHRSFQPDRKSLMNLMLP